MTDEQIVRIVRETGYHTAHGIHMAGVGEKIEQIHTRWWAKFLTSRTIEWLATFMVPLPYLNLARLEEQGTIRSYWHPQDDYPRRRYYCLVEK